MSGYIARALIEHATWESIQARPYDGTRYPCGCHPDPKEPHRRFYLCDYHDGFDAGVDQGCHELTVEHDASRLIINDLTAEVDRLQAERDEHRDAARAYKAEIERLRAAANRTLNAFFCCEGLDNTHLMDAFSEWAVLMGHAAVPEAKAWIVKWEARRER